jgi:hypothetical protein
MLIWYLVIWTSILRTINYYQNNTKKNFITKRSSSAIIFYWGIKKQFQIRFTQHIFSDNWKNLNVF